MAKAKKASKAASGKLHKVLRGRISASILPSEAGLSGKALDAAATLLLEAARKRGDGKPSILIDAGSGQDRITRIAVVNRDVPFLVDSISRTIAAHGLTIEKLIHPILTVRRDKNWQLADLPEVGSNGEKRESFVYIETGRIDAGQSHALEAELKTAIADVRAAVSDWPKMRALLQADADQMADAEGAALLRWLGGGMMTQLGHVSRSREGKQSGLLGICRKSAGAVLADETWDRAFAWFDSNARAPLIIKANRLSLVHRRVPLDLFILPVMTDGRVSALSAHIGIWTSAALTTAPDNVPILRQQMAGIMAQLQIDAGSHDHKALEHSLSVLPHDLIVSFSQEDAARVATNLMALIDRPRPRVITVSAPLERHIFAFVWLPRDMLSTAVRLQIQDVLEEGTSSDTLDWSLMVEGGNLALLRYVLDARDEAASNNDPAALDARLQELLRGWEDAVETALGESEDAQNAAALASHHAPTFPPAYRASYGAAEAACDIGRLQHLGTANTPAENRDVRLFTMAQDDAQTLRLKVYQTGGDLPLSDAVPALENFGFRVLSELPTRLSGKEEATIHDFQLEMPSGLQIASILDRGAIIEQAVCGVLNQNEDDDVFNRLVVCSGLSAQEAEWLRAFYRYLRQANIAFTIYSVVDALAGAPDVTRALIDLFRARHDPAIKGGRAKACASAEQAIKAGLANVGAINDDRILRLYWRVISAVLRTNVFAPAALEALAFKLDSSLVPGLPKPLPWREIFVYSRRVEGIHLRAGPVARGGIRWSDRRDDFRTEVLGLMKAQRVKNAVIVPTGAKGGFYPKQLPNPALDRDAWYEEGRESYQVYIRSLLSITDNIVAEKVVHPQSVVIHDGEDPYFVVAADKGTARFSDTANALAMERDFWLGDAFASGGSNGYDHKGMGITARGGWICVQRHFLEMGVDIQKEPVQVVGCGDMSGDVFGNGMLLSKAIKLVAAFDHRHIFIDPDPDPAISWKERKRLFNKQRSNWADYNTQLLSKGGGIFPRSQKRIPLTAQARKALGIEDKELDPDRLIAAILKSPTDLVWFGGIGTYVKSESQTHAQVGDPANDGLRVDGKDLRAKVIGEGANLGLTQAGRIEFAMNGGRINTDFIDNSAGVDCSDNEVNIKIALNAVRKAGRLSEDRRNALLVEMTDEVAELVLEDNRLQSLALSIAEAGGAQAMGAHIRLIETLEEMGELDRKTQGLPDSDVLKRRAADGQGLTRPELAVLLSSTKLLLQDAVEESGLAQDAAAEALVLDDFPPQLQAKFAKALLSHRLRKEIVGTVVANRMVNRMGLVLPFELAEEEGVSLGRIGCAFVAACNLFDLDALWARLDSTKMPEQARLLGFDRIAKGLRSHMADILRADGCRDSAAELISSIGSQISALSNEAANVLGTEARSHIDALCGALIEAGMPQALARDIGRIHALDGAVGIARLSVASNIATSELTSAFVSLGSAIGLDWAQSSAAQMSPSDPWERLLVSGLARDFQHMRLEFLGGLVKGARGKATLSKRIANWETAQESRISQFRSTIARAKKATPLTPAALAQIAGQARGLLQG